MCIRLLVGLGNPGQQYKETRHNAGFWFLDGLAAKYGVAWAADAQFLGQVSAIQFDAAKLLLLKPQTFMNRSGQSVGSLLRYYKLGVENLLVIHDELDLSAGVVRLKKGGGHAGHNGLRDIIANLGGNDFYRLRIGIGRPISGSIVANYVLSSPSNEDLEKILESFCGVYGSMDLLFNGKFEQFMNRLH